MTFLFSIPFGVSDDENFRIKRGDTENGDDTLARPGPDGWLLSSIDVMMAIICYHRYALVVFSFSSLLYCLRSSAVVD